MAVNETKIGWLCLAVSLALSAGLLARTTNESNAYFTDTKTGTMSGTYAHVDPVPTKPYRIEPGSSKALHWGPGDDAPACGEPIAQLDPSGSIYLDFGEAPPGHGDSRPDVFRLVSLADDARSVDFDIAGDIADFVSLVKLDGHASDSLHHGATGRVSMQVRIPKDAAPGTYTGVITIRVEGWAEDAHIPMTIDVIEKRHGNDADEEAPHDSSDEDSHDPAEEESHDPGADDSHDSSDEHDEQPSREDSAVVPPAPCDPEPEPEPEPRHDEHQAPDQEQPCIPSPEQDVLPTPEPEPAPCATETVGASND